MHDCVAWDEVAGDFEALGWGDALGAEENRGPYAQGFVDDGFEEREGVFAGVSRDVGEKFGADGGHVMWVRGKVHEDEGQSGGCCFAAGRDDEA